MYMENTQEDLMTLEDLCDKLMISEGTAYHLLRNGDIKAFRVGNRWKIPSDAVKIFIAEQTKNSFFSDKTKSSKISL